MKTVYRIIFGLFLIFTVISCGKKVDESTAMSDVQISDIRDGLNLWNLMEKQDRSSPELKQGVALLVLKNLMLVRSLNPDVNKLGGESLETLCLLSESKGRIILESSGNEGLSKRANEYLDSIEKSVRSVILDAQKNTKGSGCYITGSG